MSGKCKAVLLQIFTRIKARASGCTGLYGDGEATDDVLQQLQQRSTCAVGVAGSEGAKTDNKAHHILARRARRSTLTPHTLLPTHPKHTDRHNLGPCVHPC
jgi:hypothetical protein